jgi:hypothetical protein
MNTKNDYSRRRNNATAITYPIVSGNIAITGVRLTGTATQMFPTATIFNHYYGDIAFKFKRTE